MIRFSFCRLSYFALIAAGVLNCPSAPAQVANEAVEIVKKSEDILSNAKTFFIDMTSTNSTGASTSSTRAQLWVKMPDKMLMHIQTPKGLIATYLTAERQIVYIQAKNVYTETKMKPGEAAAEIAKIHNYKSPGEDAARATAKLIGTEPVMGVPCKHIQYTSPRKGLTDEWYTDSAEPMPIYKRTVSVNPPETSEMFSRFSINKPIPDSTFAFTAPPGAKPIVLPVKKQ